MRPDSQSRLEHIIAACDLISQFIEGETLDDFRSDPMLRSATERQLSIIGEALTAIRKKEPELAQAVPEYRSIIDFRNLLVHGYFVIDQAVVWSILQQDLAPLRDAVTQLLSTKSTDRL